MVVIGDSHLDTYEAEVASGPVGFFYQAGGIDRNFRGKAVPS